MVKPEAQHRKPFRNKPFRKEPPPPNEPSLAVPWRETTEDYLEAFFSSLRTVNENADAEACMLCGSTAVA